MVEDDQPIQFCIILVFHYEAAFKLVKKSRCHFFKAVNTPWIIIFSQERLKVNIRVNNRVKTEIPLSFHTWE